MYHQSQGTSTCSLKSTHWHPMAGFRPAGLNALRTCPQLTSSIGSELDTFAPAKGFSDCFGNPSSHWASNSGIRQANPPIHRRICKDFLRRLTISPIWMIHTCWTQTAHGCLISGCHRWACCPCLCKALCMRPMSASFDVQNTLRNYPQGCRLLSNVQVLEGSRGREGGRKGGRLHVVLQATDCLKIKLSSNQTKLYFSLYCVCIIYNYIYMLYIFIHTGYCWIINLIWIPSVIPKVSAACCLSTTHQLKVRGHEAKARMSSHRFRRMDSFVGEMDQTALDCHCSSLFTSLRCSENSHFSAENMVGKHRYHWYHNMAWIKTLVPAGFHMKIARTDSCSAPGNAKS